HAYYIPAAQVTDQTAVIVHGYTDCAIRMMHIGRMYNRDLGFNILLPDLYYHGDSEGEAIQMGWKDRLDVMRWMAIAANIFDAQNMVVHGISMGAATTMMVSGEEQPEYVKAFVEDCGYTSVWDEFKQELKKQYKLPAFPILYTSSLLCKWRYGWSFQEASALEQVKKCRLPMLFIHGDADDYVPTAMVYPLYEAATCPKELWLPEGAAHAVSYQNYPKEYTQKVRDFLGKLPEFH
ncbi:MAG: alpha/beta hydrolase, partial [Bacteroidaceae bacterium]|nr:alpha/beta hydrolase [Bacteroidaceae bacterium]